MFLLVDKIYENVSTAMFEYENVESHVGNAWFRTHRSENDSFAWRMSNQKRTERVYVYMYMYMFIFDM